MQNRIAKSQAERSSESVDTTTDVFRDQRGLIVRTVKREPRGVTVTRIDRDASGLILRTVAEFYASNIPLPGVRENGKWNY